MTEQQIRPKELQFTWRNHGNQPLYEPKTETTQSDRQPEHIIRTGSRYDGSEEEKIQIVEEFLMENYLNEPSIIEGPPDSNFMTANEKSDGETGSDNEEREL